MKSLIKFRRRHLLISDFVVIVLFGFGLQWLMEHFNWSLAMSADKMGLISTILSSLSVAGYAGLVAFGVKYLKVKRLTASPQFKKIFFILLFYTFVILIAFFIQVGFVSFIPFSVAIYALALYRTFWITQHTIDLFRKETNQHITE